MYYRIINKKEELQIIGIRDTSFKQDEKAVGDIILLLVNKGFTKASPIHWKKGDWEGMSLLKGSVDFNSEDVVFATRQIETLMFRGYERRKPIHLF